MLSVAPKPRATSSGGSRPKVSFPHLQRNMLRVRPSFGPVMLSLSSAFPQHQSELHPLQTRYSDGLSDRRRLDCFRVDPYLTHRDANRVQPQWRTGPSIGNAPVGEIERCRVARTEQSPHRKMTETEIGLFMRAGPVAGHSSIAIPDQDQIDAGHPRTKNGPFHQAVQPTYRYPPFSQDRCPRAVHPPR